MMSYSYIPLSLRRATPTTLTPYISLTWLCIFTKLGHSTVAPTFSEILQICLWILQIHQPNPFSIISPHRLPSILNSRPLTFFNSRQIFSTFLEDQQLSNNSHQSFRSTENHHQGMLFTNLIPCLCIKREKLGLPLF